MERGGTDMMNFGEEIMKEVKESQKEIKGISRQ